MAISPYKAALMAEIRRQGFRDPDWRHKEALRIVSIEQFFDGNEEIYSIAANLEPHPELSAVRAKLEEIRKRADVAEVLVEIYEIYDAEKTRIVGRIPSVFMSLRLPQKLR